MTDERMRTELEEMNDLRLVLDFLERQLDPERVELVRRLLDEDQAFRDFAAPMLLSWNLARESVVEPLPPGELEKHWDKFTKRAGFVHQRRKALRRRFWMLAIAALAVGSALFAGRERIERAYSDWRVYETIPYSEDWITLRDGSQVLLTRGARLRASRELVEGEYQGLILDGQARFRLSPPPNKDAPMLPGMQPMIIRTRAGEVGSGRGEFTVAAFGDTTEVEAHEAARKEYIGFVPVGTILLLLGEGPRLQPTVLHERERGRLVRGASPVNLTRQSP